VQDPNLVKDQKKYKDVMREHGHLTAVLEVGNEYRKCLQGIEDAKMMITAEDDAEMKEMAREELKELEEKTCVEVSSISCVRRTSCSSEDRLVPDNFNYITEIKQTI
jgi:protein subunit release factor A